MPSFLPVPQDSDFSLSNIPFAVYRRSPYSPPHICTALGTHLLDLHVFASHGAFAPLLALPTTPAIPTDVFLRPTLNDFAALGRSAHSPIRRYLQDVLSLHTHYPAVLKDNTDLQEKVLVPLDDPDIQMCLPMHIGDYTDFYAGLNHAFNVGSLFRGAENALQKNYKHLPVGYHGRASSVVVSGTPIRRPRGQVLTSAGVPELRASERLDIELEVCCWIAKGNELGVAVKAAEVEKEEVIFGYGLMNDWSARDVQKWEYVPLGPFTSKNFGTTVGAWIILAEAVEEYRCAGLEVERAVLPYLRMEKPGREVFDIQLEVELRDQKGRGGVLARTSGRNLCWGFEQMVAQQTVSGCNMKTGDLLGSGTISGGGSAGEVGSLLEATGDGKEDVVVGEGHTGLKRRFLEDGDEVTITGWCGEGDRRIGFGVCRGLILPAAT